MESGEVTDKNLEFEQKEGFDYYRIAHVDCGKGYFFQKVIKKRNEQKITRPFIAEVDHMDNAVGSADGRVWISIPGNFGTTVGIHESYFKNKWEIEVFPLIAPFSLRETCNHFAPGKYMNKFPNDLCCKEHNRKTAGMLIRNEGGWVLFGYAFNLLHTPEEKDLRVHSYGACCFKEHCDPDKIPTPEQFSLYNAKLVLEMQKKYDTNQKILDLVNIGFNERDPGNYKIEINNPNADLEKDGTFWNTKYRKALFIVHVNGYIYQYFERYYDNMYYKTEGDTVRKLPYHLEYEYIKDEDINKDIHLKDNFTYFSY